MVQLDNKKNFKKKISKNNFWSFVEAFEAGLVDDERQCWNKRQSPSAKISFAYASHLDGENMKKC